MFSEFSVRAQQWRDFATAHSRGLRPVGCKRFASLITLPQRIRAGCDSSDRRRGSKDSSLPQRIRAGCDSMDPFTANNLGNFATAHSRGLRL